VCHRQLIILILDKCGRSRGEVAFARRDQLQSLHIFIKVLRSPAGTGLAPQCPQNAATWYAKSPPHSVSPVVLADDAGNYAEALPADPSLKFSTHSEVSAQLPYLQLPPSGDVLIGYSAGNCKNLLCVSLASSTAKPYRGGSPIPRSCKCVPYRLMIGGSQGVSGRNFRKLTIVQCVN
jgi:hypothetical protein